MNFPEMFLKCFWSLMLRWKLSHSHLRGLLQLEETAEVDHKVKGLLQRDLNSLPKEKLWKMWIER